MKKMKHTGVMHIRGLRNDLISKYKSICALRSITMKDSIENHIKKVVRDNEKARKSASRVR